MDFECATKEKKGNSWCSNLLQHIESKHAYVLTDVAESRDDSKADSSSKCFSFIEGVKRHALLELFNHDSYPFNFVENKIVRKHMAIGLDCYKTSISYLEIRCNIIEDDIPKKLPICSALVLDGCSDSNKYYFGIFTPYPSDRNGAHERFESVLLALLQEGEASIDTHGHLDKIEFVLSESFQKEAHQTSLPLYDITCPPITHWLLSWVSDVLAAPHTA